MVHIPVGIRAFEQQISRTVHIRSPDAGNSTASAVPSSTPPPVQLSTSVKSLIGAIVIFGVIILSIAAYKVRSAYRKRKAPSPALKALKSRISVVPGTFSEKKFPTVLSLSEESVDEPRKAALIPPIPSSPVWVPQIRNVTLPSGVSVPPVAVTAPTRSPKIKEDDSPKFNDTDEPSPPPAYVIRLAGLNSIPPPPTPLEAAHAPLPPPTPMLTKKDPIKKVSMNVTVSSEVDAPQDSFNLPPVPSPRSASFHHASLPPPPAPFTSVTAVFKSKKLPRLMLVSTPFTPTRDDELNVRTGETLRMVEEFEDEWCLVQRVGRSDAEKGVIPRFCLVERPRVVEKQRSTLHSFSAFHGIKRKV